MKKLHSAILCLALLLSLAAPVHGAAVSKSDQKLLLDGNPRSFVAYNIDGYNYFRLRDLAILLSGTACRFNVGWDEATRTVSVTTGAEYDASSDKPLGDEDLSATAEESRQTLLFDGAEITGLHVYNIGGYNFFRLAELKEYLGYSLDYDEQTRCILMRTGEDTRNPAPAALPLAADYAQVLAALKALPSVPSDGMIGVETESGSTESGASGFAVSDRDAAAFPHSETNGQVEGIDEGDVVKTDGNLLYMLRDDRLIIAEAKGKDTRVLSSTVIGRHPREITAAASGVSSPAVTACNAVVGNAQESTASGTAGTAAEVIEDSVYKSPRELYLYGDKIVVISQYSAYTPWEMTASWKGIERQRAIVDLYSLGEDGSLSQEASLAQDGYFMSSRLLDGTLYAVSAYAPHDYDEGNPGTFIPCLYSGETVRMQKPQEICIAPHPASSVYMVLAAYDLAAARAEGSASVLGGGDGLYMSHDSIYVAGSYQRSSSGAEPTAPEEPARYSSETMTELYRFDLTGGLKPAAYGTVPGSIRNSYSMDEYQNHLRIVTTCVGYDYYITDVNGGENADGDQNRAEDTKAETNPNAARETEGAKATGDAAPLEAQDTVSGIEAPEEKEGNEGTVPPEGPENVSGKAVPEETERMGKTAAPKDTAETEAGTETGQAELREAGAPSPEAAPSPEPQMKTFCGLYILDPSLTLTGKAENLGEGEEVYSVRFNGEIAYVCTYRETDPLFAVDVSDPAAPKVLHTLKLSGFSEYLHPWTEDLLFGAGREANPETGELGGVKLVMFDTHIKDDVTVAHTVESDCRSSAALYDHRAFLFDLSRGLVSFPGDGRYCVFSYDASAGFRELANVETGDRSWNARGQYVGDAMYITGADALSVVDLNGFKQIASISYSPAD